MRRLTGVQGGIWCTRHRARAVALPIAAALIVLVPAAPCAARSWKDFLASFDPAEPPAAVLDYLKRQPLVQAAPKPLFSEIATETVDGSLVQSFKLAGFDVGFARLEGVRETPKSGASGAQTVALSTALGGLVMISAQNRTTGALSFLRKIELSGDFFPPSDGHSLSLKYERVQLTKTAVVEEVRDCRLTWTTPLASAQDDYGLSSRCVGSTKVSQPAKDGSVLSTDMPEDLTTALVYRAQIGWIFDERTRVVDVKPSAR